MNRVKKNIVRCSYKLEPLTDEIVVNILGGRDCRYISYNYDTGAWRQNNVEHAIAPSAMAQHTQGAVKLKNAIEATDFGKLYQLAGYVVLSVWAPTLMMWDRPRASVLHNPLPCRVNVPVSDLKKESRYQALVGAHWLTGHDVEPTGATAVKLIARSKADGRIVRVSDDTWVFSYSELSDVRGLNSSLKCGAILPGYRQMLIQTAIGNQKQK